jgi:hypothetical protein
MYRFRCGGEIEMGKIDELATAYEKHIGLPWQRAMAGAQRVIVVVYYKELEKSFRARKSEFEQRTKKKGYEWKEFDCTNLFSLWMANDDYSDEYFEHPDDLTTKIENEFTVWVTDELRKVLQASSNNTVVALTGVACLYGFMRISELVQAVDREIKGRLVVFFPGTKEGFSYRLLDSRDGWNYLAHGITLNGGAE